MPGRLPELGGPASTKPAKEWSPPIFDDRMLGRQGGPLGACIESQRGLKLGASRAKITREMQCNSLESVRDRNSGRIPRDFGGLDTVLRIIQRGSEFPVACVHQVQRHQQLTLLLGVAESLRNSQTPVQSGIDHLTLPAPGHLRYRARKDQGHP